MPIYSKVLINYVALSGLTKIFNEIEVKKLEITGIYLSGYKWSGYSVRVKCRTPNSSSELDVDLEFALMNGEVTPYGLTSNQALGKLENAKRKLDLELISKEQYDEIKNELIKYID